jgi:Aromatic-ring hydroxylase, C-terminal/FAD binding domain
MAPTGHPPNFPALTAGGFAGNTGIQDTHNLAWKLSLVLRSKADSSLLTTYHPERHSVGLFTASEALNRWLLRCNLSHYAPHEGQEELPDTCVELGPRYNSSQAVVYVNGARGAIYEDPFWPTAFPGSRAPHVWLPLEEGGKMSLYDVLEEGKYTLLCTRGGVTWTESAHALTGKYPLTMYFVDAERDFLSKYKIHESGAVIVRPDGIIGWKAQTDAEIPSLDYVLRKLLGFAVGEADLPPVSRSATVPEIGGMMRKMTLSQRSPPRKVGSMSTGGTSGAGGLIRRMTTMKSNRKKG